MQKLSMALILRSHEEARIIEEALNALEEKIGGVQPVTMTTIRKRLSIVLKHYEKVGAMESLRRASEARNQTSRKGIHG